MVTNITRSEFARLGGNEKSKFFNFFFEVLIFIVLGIRLLVMLVKC